MNDDMKKRIKKASGIIVESTRRIYDENGNVRPEYRPKSQYKKVLRPEIQETVTVRKLLIFELARIFDDAYVHGHLSDYHPGQIGWIIANLDEILKTK